MLGADQPFGLQFGDELLVDVESPLNGGDPVAVTIEQRPIRAAGALRHVCPGGLSAARIGLVGTLLTFVKAFVGLVNTRAQIIHLALHVRVAGPLTCVQGQTFALGDDQPRLRDGRIDLAVRPHRPHRPQR